MQSICKICCIWGKSLVKLLQNGCSCCKLRRRRRRRRKLKTLRLGPFLFSDAGFWLLPVLFQCTTTIYSSWALNSSNLCELLASLLNRFSYFSGRNCCRMCPGKLSVSSIEDASSVAWGAWGGFTRCTTLGAKKMKLHAQELLWPHSSFRCTLLLLQDGGEVVVAAAVAAALRIAGWCLCRNSAATNNRRRSLRLSRKQ